MAHTFPDLVIGGVLLAPFVIYLVVTLVIIIVLRPLLLVVGFAKMFSHAAIAELSLGVTILGLLMLLF
jgi:type III secretory pathway component EscV